MATNSRQTTLGQQYPTPDYRLGDLTRTDGSGRTCTVKLVECPLCRVDPYRPRHHFDAQESRADHFAERHDISEVL